VLGPQFKLRCCTNAQLTLTACIYIFLWFVESCRLLDAVPGLGGELADACGVDTKHVSAAAGSRAPRIWDYTYTGSTRIGAPPPPALCFWDYSRVESLSGLPIRAWSQLRPGSGPFSASHYHSSSRALSLLKLPSTCCPCSNHPKTPLYLSIHHQCFINVSRKPCNQVQFPVLFNFEVCKFQAESITHSRSRVSNAQGRQWIASSRPANPNRLQQQLSFSNLHYTARLLWHGKSHQSSHLPTLKPLALTCHPSLPACLQPRSCQHALLEGSSWSSKSHQQSADEAPVRTMPVGAGAVLMTQLGFRGTAKWDRPGRVTHARAGGQRSAVQCHACRQLAPRPSCGAIT
jgi:hypothetical protein